MTILESFEALIQTVQHAQTKPCALCESSGKCPCSTIWTCKEDCPAKCGGSGLCCECKGLGALRPERFSTTVVLGTLASWIIAMSYVWNDRQFERFNEMWEIVSAWTIELQRTSVQIEIANGRLTQDDLARNLRIMVEKYLEVGNKSKPEDNSEHSSALSIEELIALGIEQE